MNRDEDSPSDQGDIDATGDVRAPSSTTARVIPQRIGHYRILGQVGSGGMGVVYEAEQESPRRRVAIKVIKPGMDSASVVARFEAERQALAVMDHPNIARVFDGGTTDDGRPYFVMEFVRGVPITHFCDKHKLTIEQRLEFFIKVCEAVQHAHMKGVIHRDLKPSNILVEYEAGVPTAKVIDFGVAKALSQRLTERTLYTEQGQLIGTPEYMSPEQAEMSGLDIDTRSDVYSLGVILYELLVGGLPFDPETLRGAGYAGIQRMLREVDPPNPSTKLTAIGKRSQPENLLGACGGAGGREAACGLDDIAKRRGTDVQSLRKRIKRDLDWVSMKCLEKDRTRRYDTANALATDLRRYLNHEPVLAGPPSTVYRLGKFVRRNKASVISAGAIAAGLVAATVVAIVFATSEAQQRRIAEERTAEAILAREAEVVQRRRAEENEARAEAAAAAAIAARDAERLQRELAERRERELEQVAAFQASQLSGIDTAQMGTRLRSAVIDKRRAALEAAGRNPGDIERLLRELDRALAGVNFTSIALEALDENIFDRALTAIDEQFADQPLVKARLLQTVADTLRDLGLLDRAAAPQMKSLEIRRRELGGDHPDTLASLNHAGWLLFAQGKLPEAEAHFRAALDGRRRVLGDDHPDTLGSINNMGSVLRVQGRLDEAEPYWREALEGRRRVLGGEHVDTLQSLNNMGILLYVAGKPSEAEPYWRDALAGYRRVLGDAHPQTLIALNNMGMLRQSQGDWAGAERHLREALDVRRRVLGDAHPHTLLSIANMGYVFYAQGKFNEAEPYYREALAGRRRALGDDHPDTLNSIRSMGGLYQRQDRPDDAEAHMREALEGYRRTLGDAHPSTIAAMAELGHILIQQKSLERAVEAERLLREGLSLRLSQPGDDGWQIANTRSLLGGSLLVQGRALLQSDREAALVKLNEAEPLLVEGYEGMKPPADVAFRKGEALRRVIELYETLHGAAPGNGHDALLARWRAKLAD